jgi:hypothetical protein
MSIEAQKERKVNPTALPRWSQKREWPSKLGFMWRANGPRSCKGRTLDYRLGLCRGRCELGRRLLVGGASGVMMGD